MKIKDLKNFVIGLPDEGDIVISQALIAKTDNEIGFIVDIPVVGIAYNESGNELRFVLRHEDLTGVIPLDQICQFDLETNQKVDAKENKEKE